MKSNIKLKYTVKDKISNTVRKLTVKMVQAALSDMSGWMNHKDVLQQAVKEGYVRQISVTQFEWVSEEKIEDLTKLEEIRKTQRRFYRFVKTFKFIDFTDSKTAEDIMNDSRTFTENIRYAAFKACEYINIHPCMYIPKFLAHDRNMFYHEYVQALFTEQVFQSFMGKDDYDSLILSSDCHLKKNSKK